MAYLIRQLKNGYSVVLETYNPRSTRTLTDQECFSLGLYPQLSYEQAKAHKDLLKKDENLKRKASAATRVSRNKASESIHLPDYLVEEFEEDLRVSYLQNGRLIEQNTIERITLKQLLGDAEETGMKLKTNLKLYLALKNINASELSRISKVPKATISDWLSGRSPKNLNQVKMVAEVFDISIDQLVFGEFSKDRVSEKNSHSELVPMGSFEVFMKRIKPS